ncbi:MAG TPA: hypothetical protein VIK53_12280 [Verrucomicrobiae bacterium]
MAGLFSKTNAAPLVAVRKNLDLVWVWFYKDVAPTALEICCAGNYVRNSQITMRLCKLNTPTLVLAVAYAFIISASAVANIWINHVAKGSWDFYPVAEILWVLCSIFILAICGTTRGLVLAVIALLFLDSFVDICAMGDPFWWGTPPRLIQWIWETRPHGERLVSAYWLCLGGLQIPLRCFAMAWVASGGWGRKFGIIALGLNLIWFTNVQDVLYYFVWLGLYNTHIHYFFYLRPDGFWNLWNVLLLRVPIGVTIGVLLVRAGKCESRSLLTTVLIWCAVLWIVLNTLAFAVGRQFEIYHNATMRPNFGTIVCKSFPRTF